MKRCMTTYAREMVGSNDEMDLLYAILCEKYKNFIHFFRLVEDYSENIHSLDYDDSKKNSLKISITMEKGMDLKEVTTVLCNRAQSSDLYTCAINTDKKKIFIELKMN